jgi:hypothetical protein
VSEPEPAVLFAPRAATWFVGALLAALAGVVAFSVADHPRAAALETFTQATAVGDTHYYTLPKPRLAVPEPVLTWQGRPLAPLGYEKVVRDDTEMLPVTRDEATGLTLYRQRAGGDDLFVKLEVGKYLLLR